MMLTDVSMKDLPSVCLQLGSLRSYTRIKSMWRELLVIQSTSTMCSKLEPIWSSIKVEREVDIQEVSAF